MRIKVDVFFNNNEVVRVWCGILVSAAGFINNDGMFECLVAEIQYTTV